MNPALVILFFYLLLALAAVLLRGDLGEWPRVVDRLLACLVCLGAVALLVGTWKGRQPAAGPADDGASRPRPVWPWWLALVGLVAFMFLAVLPPTSVLLARPLAVERVAAGEESPGRTPPPPSDDGTVAEVDASGAGEPVASGGAGEGDGTAAAGDPRSMIERVRDLVRRRPPWLMAVMILLLVLAAGGMWWWFRRRPSTARHGDDRSAPRRPWHDDPAAPAYVREFRRLCEHLGFPPRPGDTWRELLARLPEGDPSLLEPVAVYHYRVRYEGAAADRAAERDFVRVIRAVRKAASAAPAAKTTTEA